MNRLWTEEEDDIIRADSAARVPRTVTAARLGRPVHATRNRALKLNQRIQVHLPWSAATEAALRAALTEEVPAPTDKELSRRFDRNVASIRSKIKELGLAGPRRYRRDLAMSPARAVVRAALVTQRRFAREEAKRAKADARAQRAELQAARKAAAEAAREARRAAKQTPVAVQPAVMPKVVAGKPLEVARRAVPVADRESAIARMREAWRKVSAAGGPHAADPADAERRLVSMLSAR